MKLLTALLLAASVGVAYGDTIFLNNGDQLTGTLQQIRDGKVEVVTEYAGTIHIDLGHVRVFTVDREMDYRLSDGTEARGTATGELSEDESSIAIATEESEHAVSVSDIIAAADDMATLDAAAVEAAEDEKPKIWSGTAELGVTLQSGTTDSTDISSKFTLVRTKNRHSLTLTASGLYGEVEDAINTRRYFGQLRWQFYPRDRWYTYALTNLEHDGGKKLDLRWGAGFGVGYDLIVNDDRKWSLETGLDYRKEWWDTYSVTSRPRAQRAFRNDLLADTRSVLRRLRNTPVFNSTVRSQISDLAQRAYFGLEENTEIEEDISLVIASHYEQDVLERSRIIWDLTLRPETDEFGEYRAVSDLTWSTPLSESLALRLNWLSEYDSNPGQGGVERWDNKFITSIGYKF